MKGKNLFFIGIIAVIYVASGMVMAESFLEKQLKMPIMKEWDYKENAENFFRKLQAALVGEVLDSEDKTTKESETFYTEGNKEEVQDFVAQNHKEQERIPEEITENTEEVEVIDTISANSWSEEPVGKEYFADALFIGDSRTVGLKEYGDLKGAAFFAESGMSVFDLWKKKLPVFSEGKNSFEEVLSTRKYGKIYLMLGINELGYEFENIQTKYQETLEKIQEIQEEAIIYLCANMHITQEHSMKDEIYNNENVNRINEMICGLADNKTTFYLDVNKVFDDETGSLSTEYASDSFHVYGKYYIKWVEWLCTKTVQSRTSSIN